jgi:hypothetical protein
MTILLGRWSAILACCAFWSVFYSLTLAGLLTAAAAAMYLLAEAIDHCLNDCGFDQTVYGIEERDFTDWENEIAGGADGRL